MARILTIIALLWVMPGTAFKASATAGSRGNLAEFPPIRTSLTITTDHDGAPKLAPMEIRLLSGRYYRLKIDCPDVQGDLSGWRVEMSELLNNAHLRLVTIGDICLLYTSPSPRDS